MPDLVCLNVYLKLLDDTVSFDMRVEDGDEVTVGQLMAVITGDIRALLSGERTALNYLQRMSGIATMTRKYVKQLEGTKTRVLDTRKTTPGLRMLEKAAVKIGGGVNHRIGLFDMILLKDNHVDFCRRYRQSHHSCQRILQGKR